MLFLAPAGVTLVYLLGWLFIYYLGTSVIALSHASWASVVASKYHDRSRVFGDHPGGQHHRRDGRADRADRHPELGDGHPRHGLVIVIAVPIGILMASLFTPERIVAEHSAEKVTLRDYWEMVSWPEMRRIVAAAFCLTLGPGWMSAMYLFYFHGLARLHVPDRLGAAAALHRRRRHRRGRALVAGDPDRQAPHPDGRQHRLFAGPDPDRASCPRAR